MKDLRPLNSPPGEPPGGDYAYRIAAVRRFTRFVFYKFGPLRRKPLVAGFDRYEFRIYVELGRNEWGATASWLAWNLGIDPARVSRLISRFRAHRFIVETPESYDRRIKRITLSERGWQVYRNLQRLANEAVERELARLGASDQQRLVAAMETIEDLMGNPEPWEALEDR
jgi:DNA-binding MarR family transcriptional regulator